MLFVKGVKRLTACLKLTTLRVNGFNRPVILYSISVNDFTTLKPSQTVNAITFMCPARVNCMKISTVEANSVHM
jgi:hypothetical protein